MVETSQANARKVAFQQRTLTRCLTRPFNCVSKIKKKKKKKKMQSCEKYLYSNYINQPCNLQVPPHPHTNISSLLSFLAKNFSPFTRFIIPLFFLLLLLIFLLKCLNNYLIFMYLYKIFLVNWFGRTGSCQYTELCH